MALDRRRELMARRLRACVEAWPEAETGAYNPRCCRFPKSCSATVYDEQYVTEDDLEEVDKVKWPVYGIHPHNLGEACSSHCISTTYGIRPHLYADPIREGMEEGLRLGDLQRRTMTFESTEINRPAVELMFELCLKCTERRRNCTCYERGYN